MNQEQRPLWRRVISWVLVFAALAIVEILIVIALRINGMGVDEITIWELVGVLIIPVALLGAGIWLNNAQIRREEATANQRAQDEALQQYLDQMSNLMIDQRLYSRPKESAVPLLALARTTTVLLMLDEKRKRRPLKLVYRLRLINKEKPLIDLENANLEQADLSEIKLSEAYLKRIDLRRANLRGSNLAGADLTEADLRGANLSGASLEGACLKDANLLPYGKRNPAKLSKHNFEDGAAPSNLGLSGNGLIPTNLKGLIPTNLSGAILKNADLRGALLVDAKGLAQNQVDQAIGDQNTRLPGHLDPPSHWLARPVVWSDSANGQPIGGTNHAIKKAGKELVRTASLLAASVFMWRLLSRSRR